MKNRQKFGAIGRARINGKSVAIVSMKDIRRGKDKGKVEVAYWALRTAKVPRESVRLFEGK